MFETSLALIVFLLPLAWSPGPGNLFFAANGARFGFDGAMPAMAGYHAATWIVTFAIGLGFARAMAWAPEIFAVLRWAGAAYVLWLAWRLIRAGVLTGAAAAQPATFGDGVVLLLLNPKAYVIIALMFTQFLAPGAGVGVVVLITTVFTLNNLVAFSGWVLAGDRIAGRFREAAAARWLNIALGGMLAAVAVWMLLG